MRLPEIEKKAKKIGVKDTWKYSKKELIRLVQQTEGNYPCFGTAVGSCSQFACCWHDDCIH